MRMSKEGYKKAMCKSCVMGHMEKCPDENIIEWLEEYGGKFPADCMKCQNFEKVEPIKNTLIVLHYDDCIREIIQTDCDINGVNWIIEDFPYENDGSLYDHIIDNLTGNGFTAFLESDLKEWEKNPKNYKSVKNIVMY